MGTFKKVGFAFTVIPNSVINNSELSWKAKGVFAYLASKPDGWQFSAKRISNSGNEGVRSIQSSLRELEKFGYLSRKKHHSGRIDYILSSEPECGNSILLKQQSAKTAHISKKELLLRKKLNTAAKAASIKIKNEIIPMSELEYIREDSPLRSRSKYGVRTMAVLVRAFAESAGIEIKGTFDASPWSKPLGAIYQYFEKDADKTIAFIKRAAEYFEGHGLTYTPQTLHKNLPMIDKWIQEQADKKFAHLENNPLYD